MQTWNAIPRSYAQTSLPPKAGTVDGQTAVRTGSRLAILTMFAAALIHYSSTALDWSQASNTARAIVLLFWIFAGYGVKSILSLMTQWLQSRRAAAAQRPLSNPQRRLLGLPPAQPSAPALGLQQRRPVVAPPPAAPTPIATPQRYAPASTPIVSTPLPRVAYGGIAEGPLHVLDCTARTPMTGSTGVSRASPQSNAVATPRQLQYYLDAFRRDIHSPAPASDLGYQQPFSHFGYGGSDTELSVSPGLPLGADAPKYRPSWVPKKSTVHAPDVLSPSSDEEVADFCGAVLKMKPVWLDVWTERLREWFSEHVLQALVRIVSTAHESANQILQGYGMSGTNRLPSLPSIVDSAAPSTTTDIEALLRHLQSWCQTQLYQPNSQRGVDALALNKELLRYEQLLLLLRGKRPADLLPPAPAGYIWSRLLVLADGTCVPEFRWHDGGSWGGRPWSSDLPNDSALLLYLFAAYLDAPGWELPAPARSGSGAAGDGDMARGMPLYLGQLKTRTPKQYSAILSYRPDAKPGKDVDALLALNQGTANPMFCVQADGRVLVLCGYNAVFHAIVMMLQFHKLRYSGQIGESYLSDEVLALAPVIEPPAPWSTVSGLRHHVFGVFFPPISGRIGSE